MSRPQSLPHLGHESSAGCGRPSGDLGFSEGEEEECGSPGGEEEEEEDEEEEVREGGGGSLLVRVNGPLRSIEWGGCLTWGAHE